VAAANIDGSRVEVLVVKRVRGGQRVLSSAKTRPFRVGSSGTDSLTRSAVAATAARSVVGWMRSRTAAVVRPCAVKWVT